ncbi:peptide MFS transporter [Leifsonia sp. YAF41]|uniref:peptide MFS transporter n=1 Tax=Leifsonia sp. YAF41 TaxID=3233086 RepID=UPI003F9D0EE8
MSHTIAVPSDTGRPPGRTGSFHQPRALYIVGMFELAERFSYFGMLAILIYYVYFPADKGGLGLDQTLATALVGAYSGAIYLATVLGGWIADRLLGSARTLMTGAVLVLLGHLALAFLPGFAGLIVGLALVALGSGATKATTASVVGSLYAPGDAQRIVGFTIFYLSLNLGALFGGLATAFIQQAAGFHAGFAAAAVGMLIGLIVFLPVRAMLPAQTRIVAAPATRKEMLRVAAIAGLVVLVVGSAFATGVVTLSDASALVAVIAAIAVTAYFIVMRRSTSVSPLEFRSVARYIPIFFASVVQVSLWMQLYTSVAVHAESHSDRYLFGIEFPPSTAVASGALFAIVLTPVVNAIWSRLGVRQPSVSVRYALSIGIMALCYLVLGVWSLDDGAMIPIAIMLGVVGAFFLADLVASPSGLSYATAVAPAQFRTQMVSVHSLSYAIGASLAGVLAQFYDPAGDAAAYFLAMAIGALVSAVVLICLRKTVRDGSALTATLPR